MSENKKYLERLRSIIEERHQCDAAHTGSRYITEIFERIVVWDGSVETFDLKGHAAATQCYAWGHGEENAKVETFLNTPPIASPADALRAHLVGA